MLRNRWYIFVRNQWYTFARNRWYTFTGILSNAGPAKIPDLAHDPTIKRSQTFNSIVTFYLNGSIINNVTPVVHFYINNKDMGSKELSHIPAAQLDPTGIVVSDITPFIYQVEGFDITNIKVAIDSPLIANSQVYIKNVDINGIPLTNTNVTYQPLNGLSRTYQLSEESINNGGDVLIDPTPYNKSQPGTAANPISVDGGGGSDLLYLLGRPSNYIINTNADGLTALRENSGLNQNANLTNIAIINFSDGSQLLGGHWSTAQNTANVPVNNNIVLTFNNPVQKGHGTIDIHSNNRNGEVFQSFDVATSTSLAFSGSTIGIDPSTDLKKDIHYFVTYTEGSITDLSGNNVTNTTYDFTTGPLHTPNDPNCISAGTIIVGVGAIGFLAWLVL